MPRPPERLDQGAWRLHLLARLDTLEAIVRHISRQVDQLGGILIAKGGEIMLDLSRIEAEVARNTTVDDSIKALVDQMAQQLRDLAAQLANEPAIQAQLNAFADNLTASSDSVVAKVRENTPEPSPTP